MLGRLGYKPDEAGRCRLPDIFDAILGHDEMETGRFRRQAILLRQATLILWNTQVKETDRIDDPEKLWRFKWEEGEEPEEEGDQTTEEQVRDLQERHRNFLKNM